MSAPQPPKRSYSPPPGASPAEEAAIEAMAESRGDRLVRPPQSKPAPVAPSIKIELPANLKGGIGAVGKWLAGALVAALLGTGGAVVGGQTANPVPPAVAECPAQIEQLRGEVSRLRDRADRLERRDDEALDRWRRTDTKAEDALGKATELERRVPKVNP